MKAFQKLLGGALIIQMLLGTTAFAATEPASLALPSGFMYMELDTTNENPLETHFRTLLNSILEEGTSNSAALEVIANNIDNTKIGLSTAFHQTESEPIFMLSVAMSESDFQTIVDELQGGDLTMNNLGKDRIIYLTDGDFYFSYKDGNLIASSREGILSDLLNQTYPDSLSKNTSYQYLDAKSSADNFFRFFINFAEMPEMNLEEFMIGDKHISELVKTEGFSLTQTPTGFTGILTVEPGPDFPIQSDKYSFTPDLYRKISPEHLILYSESYNWAENIKDSMSLLMDMQTSDMDMDIADIYQEISDAIIEASGLDPLTEMAPLFTQRSAFAIHGETDKQYIPAFTLLSEVNGKETLAKSTLAKLNEKIITGAEKSFNEMYDRELAWRADMEEWYANNPEYMPKPLPEKEVLRNEFYWTSTSTVNGITFTQTSFNMDANKYFYYSEDLEMDPSSVWTLSTAVTSEGLMIITSQKDLSSVISTNGGLTNDTEWQNNYEAKKVIDVSYLNFANISNYIESLGLLMDAPETELQEILDFLSPFRSIFSQSTFDNGYFLGKFKLNMDVGKLGEIAETIQAMIENFENTYRHQNEYNYETMLKLQTQTRFRDVEDNAWYTEYVNSMDRMDIMNGYANDEFKPGQSITRAEFVKTIMQMRELLGNPMYESGTGSFSDVSDNEWFTSDVYKAHKLGLVEGYNDGTFRPHQSITRAEAATIIIRLLNNLNTEEASYKAMSFNDIANNDWFRDSVQKAYNAEIIKGRNFYTFAPHANLTRAETAAILQRVMDYYYSY